MGIGAGGLYATGTDGSSVQNPMSLEFDNLAHVSGLLLYRIFSVADLGVAAKCHSEALYSSISDAVLGIDSVSHNVMSLSGVISGFLRRSRIRLSVAVVSGGESEMQSAKKLSAVRGLMSNGSQKSVGKSVVLSVTITDAHVLIAAASTCRSFSLIPISVGSSISKFSTFASSNAMLMFFRCRAAPFFGSATFFRFSNFSIVRSVSFMIFSDQRMRKNSA